MWQWWLYGALMEHKGKFHKGQHRGNSLGTEQPPQLRMQGNPRTHH